MLLEEDCDQVEVFHFLDRQYIDQLNITVGQKIRMGNAFSEKNKVESDPMPVDATSQVNNGMSNYHVIFQGVSNVTPTPPCDRA